MQPKAKIDKTGWQSRLLPEVGPGQNYKTAGSFYPSSSVRRDMLSMLFNLPFDGLRDSCLAKPTAKVSMDCKGLRHSVASKPRRRRDCKIRANQDCGFVHEGKYLTVAGVADGHGDQGQLISRYVRKKVVEYFSEHERALSDSEDDLKGMLKAAVEFVTQGLEKSGLDIYCSGSTLLVCVVRGALIGLANVGDCRAMLVEKDWSCSWLNSNHNLVDREERRRLVERGGRFKAWRVGESHQDYRIVYNVRNRRHGLNLSRSLGDKEARSAGLSSEPEISVRRVEGPRALVLGSDGFWACVREESLRSVLQQGRRGVSDLTEQLLAMCEGSDDSTVVMVQWPEQ